MPDLSEEEIAYALWIDNGRPEHPLFSLPGYLPAPLPRPSALARLVAAQEGWCSCGKRLDDTWGRGPANVDHVVPKARGGKNERNMIAMHRGCNRNKADRLPTGCELIWLAWVNARLYSDPRS